MEVTQRLHLRELDSLQGHIDYIDEVVLADGVKVEHQTIIGQSSIILQTTFKDINGTDEKVGDIKGDRF